MMTNLSLWTNLAATEKSHITDQKVKNSRVVFKLTHVSKSGLFTTDPEEHWNKFESTVP